MKRSSHNLCLYTADRQMKAILLYCIGQHFNAFTILLSHMIHHWVVIRWGLALATLIGLYNSLRRDFKFNVKNYKRLTSRSAALEATSSHRGKHREVSKRVRSRFFPPFWLLIKDLPIWRNPMTEPPSLTHSRKGFCIPSWLLADRRVVPAAIQAAYDGDQRVPPLWMLQMDKLPQWMNEVSELPAWVIALGEEYPPMWLLHCKSTFIDAIDKAYGAKGPPKWLLGMEELPPWMHHLSTFPTWLVEYGEKEPPSWTLENDVNPSWIIDLKRLPDWLVEMADEYPPAWLLEASPSLYHKVETAYGDEGPPAWMLTMKKAPHWMNCIEAFPESLVKLEDKDVPAWLLQDREHPLPRALRGSYGDGAKGPPRWMLHVERLPSWMDEVEKLPDWLVDFGEEKCPSWLLRDSIPDWLKYGEVPEWMHDERDRKEMRQWLTGGGDISTAGGTGIRTGTGTRRRGGELSGLGSGDDDNINHQRGHQQQQLLLRTGHQQRSGYDRLPHWMKNEEDFYALWKQEMPAKYDDFFEMSAYVKDEDEEDKESNADREYEPDCDDTVDDTDDSNNCDEN